MEYGIADQIENAGYRMRQIASSLELLADAAYYAPSYNEKVYSEALELLGQLARENEDELTKTRDAYISEKEGPVENNNRRE